MSVENSKADQLVQALRTSIKETERLRQLNRELVSAKNEPIAIVGMSCRFPREAQSPEELWQLLERGEDAIAPFPDDRGWDVATLYDPDPDAAGKSSACAGGFMRGVADFDPAFFGISPREALGIDPQQRLLLETAWEAIERAALDPRSLHGSQTGVFIGLWQNMYELLPMPPELEGFGGTSNVPAVASGRIAYTLGLHGPAVTIDTACSSSLVALHLACQALRQGDCQLALVGGATVMATPAIFVEFSRQRGLAPDGRCKPFSDAADGTAWGEGVGMLLVERLSDAQRNGRRVLAVVRGSAVNQDGKSQGLTAPNGPAQELVIRQALDNAGLRSIDIDAVEAHGTGTTLGDPIEAQALLATYGAERTPDRPLLLGSLKSNLGHTQAAAGVAGVIKLVLALQHELLPKSLHAEVPTTHVDWSPDTVRLLREAVAWKPNGRPRRAAVSAFGVSGTNAHVIIEEPPPSAAKAALPPLAAKTPLPFALSARGEAALPAQAARLHAELVTHPELALRDVAHSLVTSRSAFESRAVVVASTHAELIERLASVAAGERPTTIAFGAARASGKCVFVCPGQGAQWLGMARELLAHAPAFAAEMQACAAALAPFVDFELLEVLASSDPAMLERVEIVQPVLFAIMVSLAALWRAHGVEPDAVIGHSQGEIAAAYIAGALSLDDAARVVALRARALIKLRGKGGMAAIELSAAALAPHLARHAGKLSLAAINGPDASVVSGESNAIDALLAELSAQEIFGRRIRVDYASHCSQLDEIEQELIAALAPITPRAGKLAIASTLRGELIDGSALDARYWYDNGRNTVRFADAVQTLLASGHRHFIELSPHPVLTHAITATVEASKLNASVVGTLRREDGGLDRFLLSLGELHARGASVDLARIIGGGATVALPTYAFQRERYWPDGVAPRGGDAASLGLSALAHPLLGASVTLADAGGSLLTGRLAIASARWLAEQPVDGAVVLPGSALVELALVAGQSVGLLELETLQLEAALSLPERGGVQLQIALAADDDAGGRALAIHSRHEDAAPDAPWTRHAHGRLVRGADQPDMETSLATWPPTAAERIESAAYPSALRAVYRRGEELFAELALPASSSKDAARYALHPLLLELALASLVAPPPRSWAGATLRGVRLYASGASALRVTLAQQGDELAIELAGPQGEPVGRIEALQLTAASESESSAADALYRVEWPVLAAPEQAQGEWGIFGPGRDAVALSAAASYADLAAVQAALNADEAVPEALVWFCQTEPAAESIALAARQQTEALLALLQAWAADQRLARRRLLLVTRAALAADGGDEAPDLIQAPLWGLTRVFQAEHPDLGVGLLDLERSSSDVDAHAAISGALALPAEPQLAQRRGELRTPRLARAAVATAAPAEPMLSSGTVLITGGTGTLGALLAEHLIVRHGARDLLLCSRSGRAADGFLERLIAHGARVRVAACDVSQRQELASLLDSIDPSRPLSAVFHTAGVLDDGVFAAQDKGKLARVFAPKLDGALHLHELTRSLPLRAFVLFSSLAGVLGAAGQANYAAANSFLDALAQRRRAEGLPGTSLAWGFWSQQSGLTAHLERADLARMARGGIAPLSAADGLWLLDRALERADAVLVPSRFTRSVFDASSDELPALLRGLGRRRLRRATAAGADSLRQRLAGLSANERARALLDTVLRAISDVMGMAASSIDAERPLREVGLDSLMSLELRNRLAASSGLRLPSTLVFDHPTPAALARYLEAQLSGELAKPQRTAAGRRDARADEPIAIVGMSCRLPGDAESPEALWQLLEEGRDAIVDFPRDRGWDVDALYNPDPDARGTSTVCKGGFLRAAGEFDAGFFGISPREALATDPQQRLLLETAWEALEGAGIDPSRLLGSATGVFVGMGPSNYALLGIPPELEGFVLTGTASAVASGRISYTLGLQGPALTVDTACSSSLVALHLAVQSLRQGECELALAGGASVMATPAAFVEFSRQRGLASDGRCKPFSDSADGTGWAEGVGMLALQRLSDARKQARTVLALVRGSAINQDGKSQGLTAPNGPAQEQVIRQALLNAGVNADDVDVVEAHGTGTRLGDPIEAQALLATYGAERAADRPLLLGALKSNLGHTQAAAGVAGVIKMVLALQHERLPMTLHADEPTRHVDWSSGTIELLRESRPWKASARRRRAGISAFGVSGTNAHVIVEEAPRARAAAPVVEQAPGLLPFVIAAKTAEGVRAQAARLAQHLAAHPQLMAADVAYSLASTRSAFEQRAVVLAHDRASLEQRLAKLAAGELDRSIVVARARKAGPLAVLFTGQGSQRAGMGRELYAAEPCFRAALDACFAAFDGLLPRPLREVMFADAGTPEAALLDRTEYAQPALFALEVALYALLQAYGVTAEYVLGHSLGEIVAAHVASVLSLADACKLVAARARLMQALPAGGAMAALELSELEVAPLLAAAGDSVALAAVNGARSLVVSGDESTVLQLMAASEARGRKARRLVVSHAFHSPRMEPMLEELAKVAGELQYAPARIGIVSNVTGELAPPELHGDPQYWVAQVRAAVRFAPGLAALHTAGATAYLELGPQAVLSGLVGDALAATDAPPLTAAAMRKDRDEHESFLCALATLYAGGHPVVFDGLFAAHKARVVALPTYAFARERYWLDAELGLRGGDLKSLGQSTAEHPLLGAQLSLAGGEGALFTGRLSTSSQPWLAGHRIFGATVFPGTGVCELLLAAAERLGLDEIEELTLHAPLVLPERGGLQLQLSVSAALDSGSRPVRVHARHEDAADAEWTLHASGAIRRAVASVDDDAASTLRAWPPEHATPVALDAMYEAISASGIEYSGAFRGLSQVYRRGDEVFVHVELPQAARRDASRYTLHPALLDAALHVLGIRDDLQSAVLPFAWQGVSVRAAGAMALRARVRFDSTSQLSVSLADDSGAPLGRIAALHVRPASASAVQRTREASDALFSVSWSELPLPPSAAKPSWVLVGELGSVALEPDAAYADFGSLTAALDAGLSAPERVVLACASQPSAASVSLPAIHAASLDMLETLQACLRDARLAQTRWVVVTQDAVAVGDRDRVAGLNQAALWGLVRCAQSEHPDRSLQLIDLEAGAAVTSELWHAALQAEEPQLALRAGVLRVPRLARNTGELAVPAGGDWSLQIETPGTFEGLALKAHPLQPLAAGEVQVAVRAAGLNFRDVLSTLGMYPGEPGPIGLEGAGIVEAVGEGVTHVAPGDRVFGLLTRAFGPRAHSDGRTLARIPSGMSFVEAATLPTTFMTAYFALVDLGRLRAGERILIHAAAGGVGIAAVQLAQYLGAEVFATASPSKWGKLRELGLADDHIASSRTLEFEGQFRAASGGAGMDVVLDSLAQEFVDASLRLMRAGGRFLEMGKTDIRAAEQVAATHAGVWYRAFDLVEAGPERMQEMLQALGELYASGAVLPLPATSWDVRRAPEAFRHMAQARHVGKIVLTPPRALSARGTVLITGGTGTLGSLVAEHLVREHGVTRLLLCSRRGASDSEALQARLAELGAEVQIEACDIADRAQVEAVLASIPATRPLTAVIHTAAVTDDGMLAAQSGERFARVFGPKLDGAWHLHELTRDLDLDAFVMFSSIAGLFGAPGQSNYAAANSFLDALAQHRRAQGLAASSLAWGFWAERSGVSAHLTAADLERMARGGVQPLSSREGLALLDAALARGEAQWVPSRFDARLWDAPSEQLPPLFRGLARRRLRRATQASPSALGARLAAISGEERERVLLAAVLDAVRTVLGGGSTAIEPERPLSELGLDSLMAVELSNHLSALSGLRLASTVLFDHPTSGALARYLDAQLSGRRALAPAADSGRSAAPSAPIAIVAMGCRFAGSVDSPQRFWELLAAGTDASCELPGDRGWDGELLQELVPGLRGKVRGGFVADASAFDPLFFGISPREAVAIDPQQRLLLEVAWEALERAGIDPAKLSGSATGVFIGQSGSDYTLIGAEELQGFGVLNASSVASGRISYTLGLHGPALTIDTACSSSLVAVHLACQSLRDGECELALAGGATVMSTLGVFAEFGGQGVLAHQGRCKPFAEGADGMAWGEGAGMLVLERASDANAHGRRVLALVRGSAINQDGKSQGLTAPNGLAQAAVIQRALANARVTPDAIDAIEAHGTGTKLGDPIEAQALLATYGAGRDPEQPLWIGSLKSNIGHTQAAAGVASVIKMVLAMQHQRLPKTLHVDQPSQHVDWSSGALQLLLEDRAWPAQGRPRRAGVSSFGMSGTNAHLILEEVAAPSVPARASQPSAAEWWPLLLSAKSEPALRAQARRLADHLLAHPEQELPDVAHSLVATRGVFDVRAVVVGRERAAIAEELALVADGASGAASVIARAQPASGKVVFVFPGQGSQWTGMARELLASSSLFAREIAACEQALAPHVDWSLTEVLSSTDPAPLRRIDIVQPALFSVMVALAALWRSLGVEPDAVVGHSQGEVMAAYIASALSLEDAMRIVARRTHAASSLIGHGAMAAVELPPNELAPLLSRFDGRVSIAAINSPNAAVISGDIEPVDALVAELTAAGVMARRIRAADAAGHSAQIERIEGELMRELAGVSPRASKVPLYSTVDAALIEGTQLDTRYWYRNARQVVRFSETIEQLLASGHRYFIEVSPHPVLTHALESTIRAADVPATVLGTLRRDDSGEKRMLLALGELFARGARIDLGRVIGKGRAVDLPTYAFQRDRYWPSASRHQDLSSAGLASADHPLLGASVAMAQDESVVLTGRVSRTQPSWLGEHAGVAAAVIVELAWAAAQRCGLDTIETLTFDAPLLLPERGGLQLQLVLAAPDSAGRRALSLHARGGEHSAWTRHASAVLAASDPDAEIAADPELRVWPPEDATEIGGERLDALRCVRSAYVRDGEVFAELTLPDEVGDANRHRLHPLLLGAAAALLGATEHALPMPAPLSLRRASVLAHGASTLRLRISPREDGQLALSLSDVHGEAVAHIEALEAQQLTAAASAAPALHTDQRGRLYQLRWQAARGAARGADTWCLIAPPDSPLLAHAGMTRPSAHYAGLDELAAFLDMGSPAPELVLIECRAGLRGGPVQDAHALAANVLAMLQAWVNDGRLARTQLAFLTERAVALDERDPLQQLAQASIWGLVRTAQLEHADRPIKLIDWDGSASSAAAVLAALASDEPQLLLREGAMHAARLMLAPEPARARATIGEGIVLISGGTGALGQLIARHLVAHYGVRRIVLCSRSGRADALAAELASQGVELRVSACDVSQREQAAALIASLPRHELRAVVHVARVIDDGALAAQTPERMQRVFGPRLDAAHHLHELTREHALDAFVMFSSISGALGNPGQASYAAANAFVDALAVHRRQAGLPATALSWALLAASDAEADEASVEGRGVVVPLRPRDTLALFDRALASDAAQLVAAEFSALLAASSPELVPAPLRGMAKRRLRRVGAGVSAGFRTQLASASESERERLLLEALLSAIGSVLRLPSARIEHEVALQSLGMDSIRALELQRALAELTGLSLPATLLFDHNTPRALARYFAPLMAAGPASPASAAAATPLLSMVLAAHRAHPNVRGPVWSMLDAATRLRRELDEAAGRRELISKAYPIARGPSAPMLICVPTLIPPTGPGQYMRLGAAFQGVRDVAVISNPGWNIGEALPTDYDALLDCLLRSTRECAGDRPIALCGWSSGGWLAHGITSRLERAGTPPVALILFDTRIVSAVDGAIDPATGMSPMRERLPMPGGGIVNPTSDEELTAYNEYMRLLTGWNPRPIATKSLMLVPSEDWTHGGLFVAKEAEPLIETDTKVEVAGNHMSMLLKHATESARVVEHWLQRELGGDRESGEHSAVGSEEPTPASAAAVGGE